MPREEGRLPVSGCSLWVDAGPAADLDLATAGCVVSASRTASLTACTLTAPPHGCQHTLALHTVHPKKHPRPVTFPP